VALASLDTPAASSTARTEIRATGARSVDGVSVTDLVLLNAGQSTTIRETAEDAADDTSSIDKIETVDRQEMNKRLSWQRGLLTFAGDPLEKVVKEISRYTTVSIEITDPGVRAIKIGGQFPVGETDAMLDALKVNFGLRVTRLDDNHVLIASAGDSK
jgi:transmembrane sensor